MTYGSDMSFPYYPALDGSALQGVAYFGVAGQNPVTNPVTVFWDSAGTQPAAQPVTISKGRTVRSDGTPARVWVASDYSVLVQDTLGRQVVFEPNQPVTIAALNAINQATAQVALATTQAGAASTSATSAAGSATTAQTASNTALAADRIYATAAAGDTGTSAGQYYYVVSASSANVLELWLHNGSGGSDTGKRFLSPAGLAGIANDFVHKTTGARNVFDKSAISAGTIIVATTGATSANASFFATDYMPVNPGGSMVSSATSLGSSPNGLAFYDATKTYISGSVAALAPGVSISVPAGAYYVRVTYSNGVSTSQLMVMDSATIPGYYIPPGEFTWIGAALSAMYALRPLSKFNLFDSDLRSAGQLVSSTDGTLVANAGFFASGFIPATSGAALKVYPASSGLSSPYGLAWYDKDFNFLSGTAAPYTNGQSFTAPSGAVYARVCASNASLTTFMVLPAAITATVVANHTPASQGDFAALLPEAFNFSYAARPLSRFNLFDADLLTAGMVQPSGSGTLSANSGFFVTGFMPVTALGSIKTYPAISSVISPFGMAWYDKDFNYVSGVNGPFTSGQSFTAPANAVYARFTVNNAQLTTFMALPAAITAADITTHTVAKQSDFKQWAARNFMQLGDSISANTNWMASVTTYLGAASLTNNSLSGRKMIDALKDPSGTALTSASFTSTDEVNLLLGTNDFSGSTPIGAITDAPSNSVGASYYALTRYAIETMLGWKPTLRISICTLLQRTGGTTPNGVGAVINDYSTAVRNIAALYALPVLDLGNVSGINALTIATYLSDGLHPNAAGYTAGLIGPAKGFFDGIWPAT